MAPRTNISTKVLRGLHAACHVALAGYEGADGLGDVSHENASDIFAALAWCDAEYDRRKRKKKK